MPMPPSPTLTAIEDDALKILEQLEEYNLKIPEQLDTKYWMKEKELLRMLIGKVMDLCEI